MDQHSFKIIHPFSNCIILLTYQSNPTNSVQKNPAMYSFLFQRLLSE